MSVEDALFHYHFPINNPHKELFINDGGYGNVWLTKGHFQYVVHLNRQGLG